MVSGVIFILLLRTFALWRCLITTFLLILSVVIWVLFECSRKKLELTPAVPLVKGQKHLELDETQRSKGSQITASNVKNPLKPLKISLPEEESEPKPIAASLKCGRTQASHTIPIIELFEGSKYEGEMSDYIYFTF
ncbi:Uncharacterized protein BM_BM20 [Brugia malayi]|uniref:Bm20 n=1 Tax=Brugia malayi TaxID=6279 RepID=A0A4E9EVT1_BRUMA|nr:Uncharacterized protein BM_BM20 [Brugia malayi]VIO88244.1 Uncharacterized protein BM_BM20 [Brugia malayi]